MIALLLVMIFGIGSIFSVPIHPGIQCFCSAALVLLLGIAENCRRKP